MRRGLVVGRAGAQTGRHRELWGGGRGAGGQGDQNWEAGGKYT